MLNLSVWTIGAEVLNPRGITVNNLEDLADLLTLTLGKLGGPIFYFWVFAALYSSVIGNATGYGLMCADIANVSRTSEAAAITDAKVTDSSVYRWVAAWCPFRR